MQSELNERCTQGSPQFAIQCFDFKLLIFVSVFPNIIIPLYFNDKVLVWYSIVKFYKFKNLSTWHPCIFCRTSSPPKEGSRETVSGGHLVESDFSLTECANSVVSVILFVDLLELETLLTIINMRISFFSFRLIIKDKWNVFLNYFR